MQDRSGGAAGHRGAIGEPGGASQAFPREASEASEASVAQIPKSLQAPAPVHEGLGESAGCRRSKQVIAGLKDEQKQSGQT